MSSAGQALEVIPHLPALYCEPFADSSQIPTFLVSKLAREHVTVSLSGDAGDELFAGYQRYDIAERLWGRLSRLPRALRIALARAVAGIPVRQWNRMLGPMQSALPFGLADGNAGDRIVKGAELMRAQTQMDLYRLLVSLWTRPEVLVIGGTEPPTVLSAAARRQQGDSFLHDMMAIDLVTYLPDDILVKVDRAAMGVSLETRVPFLDHRLVEFAWRLPIHYKRRDGVGKWALRQVLYRYVPKELIERPKMGFGVPIDVWLRGPLRDWAEDLLNESRLRRQGYFHPAPIREKWTEHLSGARNWQYLLWNVLMFQAWLNEPA
jgi:asparagine synthase (glutamine-hydrolysing)